MIASHTDAPFTSFCSIKRSMFCIAASSALLPCCFISNCADAYMSLVVTIAKASLGRFLWSRKVAKRQECILCPDRKSAPNQVQFPGLVHQGPKRAPGAWPPSRISGPPGRGIRDPALGPRPEIRGDGQAAATEIAQNEPTKCKRQLARFSASLTSLSRLDRPYLNRKEYRKCHLSVP